jgi:hypothetical protein
VDPQIWKDLEEPVQEALRGMYRLCKGDDLKTRCLTAVGDGELLIKLFKTKHLSECKFSKQLVLFTRLAPFFELFSH